MASVNQTNQSQGINVSDLLAEDLTSRVPKIVFLLLFAVSGLVGNSLLLLVLLRGKKSVLNIMIINLCIVGLSECWMNMSIVFGALVSGGWIFGDPLCKINAFCMTLVFIELVLTLLCISVERFISVRYSVGSNNYLTIPRMLLIIVCTWIHSAAFSLPLLTTAIPTTYRTPLHLCSLTDSSSLTYICLTSVICFVIPIISMLILYLLIIRSAFKGRFVVTMPQAQNEYKQRNQLDNQKEIHMCKYGGLLFCVWFVLCVPYIITAYIRQYQYSYEFQASNFLELVDYPWSVDVTFVYMRFFYAAIFPILTFSWINFLWVNLKDFVLCRRSNSIGDMVPPKNLKKEIKNQPVRGLVIREKANSPSNQFFNVPVLFATSDGIHIETYNRENSIDSVRVQNKNNKLPVETSETKKNIPVGKACDVGPLDTYFIYHDTSDYDSSSEADAFSSSQPVSTRQVNQEIILSQRSVSQPEVHKSTSASQTSGLKDVKRSFGTDSGLDMSVAGMEASLKKRDKSMDTSGYRHNKFLDDRDVPWAVRRSNTSKDRLHTSAVEDESGEKEMNESENIDIESQYLQSIKKEMEDESQGVLKDCDNYVSVSQRVKKNTNKEGRFPIPDSHKHENHKKSKSKEDIELASNINNLSGNSESHSVTSLPPKYPNYISLAGDPRKKSQKKVNNSNSVNLGETFNVVPSDEGSADSRSKPAQPLKSADSTRKMKCHQRHDTADSLKSLLGSGSSCELASLKAESFPDLEKTDTTNPNDKDGGRN
ncbi:uncharacterized protein LOC126814767 [Patella vulgata]|uniref:uncharacterized protein LOC126814767 n=1 Tax=Patella vulgata TaxID=6465 RepID=UPI00217FC909|nr:uncharacterized protein LOC126814767 [Patella vulgata]